MSPAHRLATIAFVLLLLIQAPGYVPVAGATSSPVVRGLSSVSNVKGGIILPLTVRISGPAASGGTTVALHSNRPSVIAVPDEVTVPSGETETVLFLPTKEVEGDVTVTFTSAFAGGRRTKTVNVRAPILLDFTGAQSVRASSKGEFQARISAPGRTNGTHIKLLSSNPAVLRVAEHAIVRGGERSARVFYTTYAVKTDILVQLTAILNGMSITLDVVVKPKPPYDTFEVFHTSQVVVDSGGSSSVQLDPVPKGAGSITVTSSDPSILRIDTPQPMAISDVTTPFDYTAFGEGTVIITATWKGISVSRDVSVSLPWPSLVLMANPVGYPGYRYGQVVFPTPAGRSGTTITLESSDPTVLQVPAEVVVPEGATSVLFRMDSVSSGSADVTITTGHYSKTKTITVEPLAIELTTIYDEFSPGEVIRFRYTLNANALSGMDIMLSSSNPAVLPVPEKVKTGWGSSSGFFNVVAGETGSATITATIAGASTTVEIRVTSSPTLVSAYFVDSLIGTEIAAHYVTMSAPVPEDTFVSMTSSDESIIPDAMVLVPKGKRLGGFALKPLTSDTVSLTFTHGSISKSYALTVPVGFGGSENPDTGTEQPTLLISPTPETTISPSVPTATISPQASPSPTVDLTPEQTPVATEVLEDVPPSPTGTSTDPDGTMTPESLETPTVPGLTDASPVTLP